MDAVQFEETVGAVLTAIGYTGVAMTKRTGDHGVDLNCVDPAGRSCVVQCKHYSSPVGEHFVRDLAGTRQYFGADRAILVTTSRFTPHAAAFAEHAGIELIDGQRLVELGRRARAADPAAGGVGSTGPAPGPRRLIEVAAIVTATALVIGGAIGSGIGTHRPISGSAEAGPDAATPTGLITTTTGSTFAAVNPPTATTAAGTPPVATTASNTHGPTSTEPPRAPAPSTAEFAPDRPSSSQPAASPAHAGVVDVRAVTASPYVGQVAKLFDTYFSGINNKDYKSAASVFAAGGVINPSNPSSVDAFASSTSTTHDDQIVVTRIDSATVDGRPGLTVDIDFRSRQSAGQGFDGQTCSVWHIAYVLVRGGTGYLLLGPRENVEPQACP